MHINVIAFIHALNKSLTTPVFEPKTVHCAVQESQRPHPSITVCNVYMVYMLYIIYLIY